MRVGKQAVQQHAFEVECPIDAIQDLRIVRAVVRKWKLFCPRENLVPTPLFGGAFDFQQASFRGIECGQVGEDEKQQASPKEPPNAPSNSCVPVRLHLRRDRRLNPSGWKTPPKRAAYATRKISRQAVGTSGPAVWIAMAFGMARRDGQPVFYLGQQ